MKVKFWDPNLFGDLRWWERFGVHVVRGDVCVTWYAFGFGCWRFRRDSLYEYDR